MRNYQKQTTNTQGQERFWILIMALKANVPCFLFKIS